MTWQQRALEYIDLVPELSYASRFYSRMLKLIDVYPAHLDDMGRLTRISEGAPVELLNRIQDPGGGRSQILGNFGRLAFTTGEGNLFGRSLGTDDESWLYVWNDEIEVKTDGQGEATMIIHKPVAGEDGKEYSPDDAVVYRFWTPHPRRSGEADSPMRAALDVAEELIILTKSVRSTAVTRMTNGIVAIAQEISPAPAEPIGDEDPLNHPFLEDFVNHITAQVEDAGSAAASAPFVFEGPGEFIGPDMFRWVQTHDPSTDYMERDLRKEAIDRLAFGLDMPPEILKGLGSTNHWAAMQILHDMWRSHGAPMAEQFCDDLNETYLRPALRQDGYPDWRNVVVAFDDSRVTIKVDRGEDADRAFDRGQISGDGYRRLKNIPEEYAPSEDEHREYLAVKLRNPQLIGADNGGNPMDGPPPPGPEGDSGRRTRVVAAASVELGAAEMALLRCRELAGIRIRQKEKLCPDCLKPAEAVANALVASAVGPEVLQQMELDPVRLVRGGADSFRALLATWGFHDAQAAPLARLVETHAARTLFEAAHPRLPDNFVAHVESAREFSHAEDRIAV